MSIRVTGMNSGMDTDAMVKELVSAYQKKGDKTVKEKTKLEWKQEIWTDLNKKIKSFATKVRSFRFESNYAQKKTTSSDESKVSVIAGDNAVRGSQTMPQRHLLQVERLRLKMAVRLQQIPNSQSLVLMVQTEQ